VVKIANAIEDRPSARTKLLSPMPAKKKDDRDITAIVKWVDERKFSMLFS